MTPGEVGSAECSTVDLDRGSALDVQLEGVGPDRGLGERRDPSTPSGGVPVDFGGGTTTADSLHTPLLEPHGGGLTPQVEWSGVPTRDLTFHVYCVPNLCGPLEPGPSRCGHSDSSRLWRASSPWKG